MRALTELADGLADAPGELLGPAALFRLRGRHRAQLVVEDGQPAGGCVACRQVVGVGGPGDARGRSVRSRRR